MHELEPSSVPAYADRPRHAHQEITDLLAAALLRLRARGSPQPEAQTSNDSDTVGLGFPGQERVNANPDHTRGVRQ
ncbi:MULTISPECIES: hypothetical protein [Betaproteobacteria]|jgi:hypothetical protein|uniref:hypothetical protein n=1 Tax=Betaproteobacteria TaxID=28216 RepID=UPI000C7A0CC8|nr:MULTISPECIES: hypothetical protein [Betaproteobacteria]MCG9076347.1 hypothetical protein [Laribacter hongkongensis]PLT16371.1 hypothetical protein CXP34_19695 [Ralstonia mannitolilytica]